MTTKAQILKTIRAYCVGCSDGSEKEVALCTVKKCELYEFRMGKDPRPARSGPKVMPWLKKKNESGNKIDIHTNEESDEVLEQWLNKKG